MSVLVKVGSEWQLIDTPSGGFDGVVAPSPTFQTKSPGNSLDPVTFGSFDDPGGFIASYSISTINGSGSTSWSGTGLGAYSPSSDADGSNGTLLLNALDSSGNVLATASHTYNRSANVPSVVTIKEVDWAQLWIDNGSVDVDLSSAGTYAINGENWIVDVSTAGQTATLKSSGLEIIQTPGTSIDWSIATQDSYHTSIAGYSLLVADMTSTVSSQTSLGTSAGVIATGYADNPNWASNPPLSWTGAGWDINGPSSQEVLAIIRGTTAFQGTSTQSPKVNPTTTNHRVYINGTTYGAALNSVPFDGTTLKPGAATYTNGYSSGVNVFPPDNVYTTACYPAIWTVGANNCEINALITHSAWRIWPTP